MGQLCLDQLAMEVDDLVERLALGPADDEEAGVRVGEQALDPLGAGLEAVDASAQRWLNAEDFLRIRRRAAMHLACPPMGRHRAQRRDAPNRIERTGKMTRKTKILGLALVTALAVGALAASGTHADWEFEPETEGLAFFTGTQITHNGQSYHTIKVEKYEITCKELFFTGETKSNPVGKLTLVPTFKGTCETEKGAPVTVAVNGCDYTLYDGTQTENNKNHFFDGAFGIDCEKDKQIEIFIYENAFKHSSAPTQPKCTITLPDQLAVANTWTNTDNGVADVDLTTELELTAAMDGQGCGSAASLAYTGATTLKAFGDAAHTKQVPLKFK